MTPAYYPSEIAGALHERWPAAGVNALPEQPVLAQFLSTIYQASLLREEGRPVECHVVLATAAQLAAPFPLPTGYHVVAFGEPRPWDEQEVRRLSPAVARPSTLLAVHQTAAGELVLWGLLVTDMPWDHLPGSPPPAPGEVPPVLVVHVQGPGTLTCYCGATRVLTLRAGRVDGHGFLQFPEAWSRGRFEEVPEEYARLSGLAQRPTAAQLGLIGLLGQHVQRRAVARVRAGGHGGLLVFVSPQAVAELLAPGGLLQPKYPTQELGTGARCGHLFLAIVQRQTELGDVSWAYYQQSRDATLRTLAAAVDHFADLLADLMAVDGALVLTKNMELVGFGVEIRAPQVAVDQVYRALDLESEQLHAEPADQGGTRHRAAYRLCLAAPDCLAVAVSQDGGVQLVHHHAGKIVFWSQLS
ncbi:putative sensor domain DACNV-containing protein [uncultured Hymenobacter sp.]|uniref:putative sensor domain DACNV-containing protein n=1 Tax=uncultured Hymenobacter sp. TaxID=170016 RepID=UPI0035CBB5B9